VANAEIHVTHDPAAEFGVDLDCYVSIPQLRSTPKILVLDGSRTKEPHVPGWNDFGWCLPN